MRMSTSLDGFEKGRDSANSWRTGLSMATSHDGHVLLSRYSGSMPLNTNCRRAGMPSLLLIVFPESTVEDIELVGPLAWTSRVFLMFLWTSFSLIPSCAARSCILAEYLKVEDSINSQESCFQSPHKESSNPKACPVISKFALKQKAADNQQDRCFHPSLHVPASL